LSLGYFATAVELRKGVAVSGPARIHRQQIIREVEGYLELLMLWGEQDAVSPANRDRIIARALGLLEHIPDGGSEWVHSLYLKGEALKLQQRYADAIPPLKQAGAIDAGNISIWLALGWCYKRVNRIDLAIEALEEALQAEPEEAILHYNLACYWSLSGNVRRALEYLHHALQIDPEYRDKLDAEHDFDPIRNDPGFQALNSVVA